MHSSCICASKFAPEGQITGAFPPTKSAGLSSRSCVTSQVHQAILWAIFLPQHGIVSMFFSGVGRQPISASPVLFLANEGWISLRAGTSLETLEQPVSCLIYCKLIYIYLPCSALNVIVSWFIDLRSVRFTQPLLDFSCPKVWATSLGARI